MSRSSKMEGMLLVCRSCRKSLTTFASHIKYPIFFNSNNRSQEFWSKKTKTRFVELANDKANVRDQDYFTCMENIAANPIGESIVWDFVRENWQKLVVRFGLNERYLGRMIPSICGRFSTNTKLAEVKAFFEKYPEAGAGAAARAQTIEDITNRIKWLENNQEKVAGWLNKNVQQ